MFLHLSKMILYNRRNEGNRIGPKENFLSWNIACFSNLLELQLDGQKVIFTYMTRRDHCSNGPIRKRNAILLDAQDVRVGKFS